MAYKLDLPSTAQIYPVFHVSLLKKAVSQGHTPQPLPPMLKEDYQLEVVPADLLNWRQNSSGQLEVLIAWKDLPDCENSWELAATVLSKFPDFPLEDKVILLGGVLIGLGESLL